MSSATRLPFEAKKRKSNCAKRIKTQGALPAMWSDQRFSTGGKEEGRGRTMNNYISFFSLYDCPFT